MTLAGLNHSTPVIGLLILLNVCAYKRGEKFVLRTLEEENLAIVNGKRVECYLPVRSGAFAGEFAMNLATGFSIPLPRLKTIVLCLGAMWKQTPPMSQHVWIFGIMAG